MTAPVAETKEIDLKELDKQVDKYTKPENIEKAFEAGEQTYKVLSRDLVKELRVRCKKDLFFLAYSILGYNKLAINLHGHLAAWAIRNRAARFREILLPRGHFKSTIMTIADSIRICLPDDEGTAPWPENLGPNCRLLIGHETADQASKFLVSIIGHFTSNPLLMGLFPECVPNIRQHRINRQELELPRTRIWSEATYSTMGVGAKSQGKHFNYLKLDDLIGDKARESKSEMETAIDWFDSIQSFFSEFNRDKFDLIGTRYGLRDLYQHVHESYGKSILKYIRPVEELVVEIDKESGNEVTKVVPIFPEGGFTSETIAILKKNPKTWVQYSNDPKNLNSKFDLNWLQYYEFTKDKHVKIIKPDGEMLKIHPQQMDLVFLLDPAMSGKAGFLITGSYKIDKHEDVVVLEALKDSWSPNQICDLIFQKVAVYRPRTVVIEKVLFSGLFEPWFKTEMKLRGIRFHVTSLETLQKEKEARVLGLTNYFAAGKIHIHRTQLDLIQEYKEFGSADDYHMLDALAQGPKVWTFPFTREQLNAMQAVEESRQQQRDPTTGY